MSRNLLCFTIMVSGKPIQSYIHTHRVGKSRFTVVSTWNSLFSYYIIFHEDNHKPTFAHPVHIHTHKHSEHFLTLNCHTQFSSQWALCRLLKFTLLNPLNPYPQLQPTPLTFTHSFSTSFERPFFIHLTLRCRCSTRLPLSLFLTLDIILFCSFYDIMLKNTNLFIGPHFPWAPAPNLSGGSY